MGSDADTIDMTGTREVHNLLEELDCHVNGRDASGRALLYQAKERIRLLNIRIARSNVERVAIPRTS